MGVKKWFLASSLAHMDYLIKYFIIFMNRILNSYDTSTFFKKYINKIYSQAIFILNDQ